MNNLKGLGFTEQEKEELFGKKKEQSDNKIPNALESFVKEASKDKDIYQSKGSSIEPTNRICPLCKEGKLLLFIGRNGNFLGCDMFSRTGCKYKQNNLNRINGK